MAFATGTGANRSLDAVFGSIEGLASQIKVQANKVISESASGALNGEKVVWFFNFLGNQRSSLEALVSGISAAAANAYADERYSLTGYNVVNEYTAMRDQIDATMLWIKNNVPIASLLTFDTTDREVKWATYTAGATSSFRTVLAALVATID